MSRRAVELFDQVAPVYDEILPFFSGWARLHVDWVDPDPGIRVLDLGAGAGALTGAFLGRDCQVTSIDAAPAMVAKLSARYPQAQASVMDAHRLEFPDSSFDLVCSGFVMHLVDDPDAVAAEVRRVLAPGGTFTFSGPSGTEGDRWDFYGDLIREYDAYTGPDGGRLGWPLDGGELLIEAGFGGIEEIDVEQQFLVPDADTFWQFALSHGSRALIDTLPERRRDEFEAKLRAELAGMDPIVYEAGATLYQARA